MESGVAMLGYYEVPAVISEAASELKSLLSNCLRINAYKDAQAHREDTIGRPHLETAIAAIQEASIDSLRELSSQLESREILSRASIHYADIIVICAFKSQVVDRALEELCSQNQSPALSDLDLALEAQLATFDLADLDSMIEAHRESVS